MRTVESLILLGLQNISGCRWNKTGGRKTYNFFLEVRVSKRKTTPPPSGAPKSAESHVRAPRCEGAFGFWRAVNLEPRLTEQRNEKGGQAEGASVLPHSGKGWICDQQAPRSVAVSPHTSSHITTTSNHGTQNSLLCCRVQEPHKLTSRYMLCSPLFLQLGFLTSHSVLYKTAQCDSYCQEKGERYFASNVWKYLPSIKQLKQRKQLKTYFPQPFWWHDFYEGRSLSRLPCNIVLTFCYVFKENSVNMARLHKSA